MSTDIPTENASSETVKIPQRTNGDAPKLRDILTVGSASPNEVTSESKRTSDSLTSMSASLSASSSLSGSAPKGDTRRSPTAISRFKHYHKPTVSDSPKLVALCERYIEDRNIEALAAIARTRGLPPSLRQFAWPLLLQAHPYVINPFLAAEFPPTGDSAEGQESIPIRRIRGEISRYRKKQLKSKYAPSSSVNTSHYHSTASTPMSISPANSSSGHSLADGNGSALYDQGRSGVTDETFSQYLVDSLDDQRYQLVEDAVVKFLTKWGSNISYEPGITWMALALAEWVNPVHGTRPPTGGLIDQSLGPHPHQNHESETTTVGFWDESPDFPGAFEQLMLVLLHSPAPNANGPYGPCDSAVTDRISLFLSSLRKLLPELAAHFDEEDVVSSIGDGDVWLVWWIKWMGAKVWNTTDRARIWDMYLGWRPTSEVPEADIAELGPDPFWSVTESESNTIVDPHTQHLFLALAMLKSRRGTLMELDQCEVREFLCRLSRSKDIESVISEGGELWRSWKWIEENDESIGS